MMEDADNIKNPARLRFSFCLPQKDCLPLTHPGSPFTDTFRDGIHEILTVNSPASYQAENAAIAYALANSVWEGRFEQILPNCYLDGAHNADGIRMLLASLSPIAAGKKVTLLFTAVKEKDTDEMIRELCESGLFCRYLVTTVEGARAIAPEQLKETFLRYTRYILHDTERSFSSRTARCEGGYRKPCNRQGSKYNGFYFTLCRLALPGWNNQGISA